MHVAPAMSFGFFFRNRVSDTPLLPLTNTHPHPPSAPLTSPNTTSKAPSPPSSALVLGNGRILAATMPHLSSKHQDPYLALSREEEHLQKDLQKLIDAQSEGLLAGFAGASDLDERDNISSTGSRTPTTTSIRSTATPWGLNQSSSHYAPSTPITIPIRQPTRRNIGLHGARRGITRAISSLAHLKSSQASLLSSQLLEKSSDLSAVQSLSAKQSTLEEQIRAIAQGEDASRRISEMKKEEKVLDEEIRELEDRLWQMKARQNRLLRDIQGLENRVESQLSSYKAALELTKKEAKSLLKRELHTTATAAAHVAIGGQYKKSTGEGIWSLPPDRRTLPMAEEHFLEEQQTLTRLIEAAKFEQKECEEGAQVWEDVIQSVSAVETMLRTEMKRMTNPSPPPRPPLLLQEIQSDITNNEITELSPEARIKKVIGVIHNSILLLENRLSLARQRGWKLLDVCISAEVEAMREGEQVLSDALNPAPSSPYSSRADDDPMDADEGEGLSPVVDRNQLDDWPTAGTHQDDGDDVWGESHHQQQQQQQQRLSHVRSAELLVERSEDEYDYEGPGPELLISHF